MPESTKLGGARATQEERMEIYLPGIIGIAACVMAALGFAALNYRDSRRRRRRYRH